MFSGKQSDRAIAAVKQLIASGKIAEDAIIRIVGKEGNINNSWGRNLSIKNWREETGIILDARVQPNLPGVTGDRAMLRMVLFNPISNA